MCAQIHWTAALMNQWKMGILLSIWPVCMVFCLVSRLPYIVDIIINLLLWLYEIQTKLWRIFFTVATIGKRSFIRGQGWRWGYSSTWCLCRGFHRDSWTSNEQYKKHWMREENAGISWCRRWYCKFLSKHQNIYALSFKAFLVEFNFKLMALNELEPSLQTQPQLQKGWLLMTHGFLVFVYMCSLSIMPPGVNT